MTILVTIPGPPCAQGRGRAVRFGNSVRVIDPGKSRSWKGAAQVHMLAARAGAGLTAPMEGPLVVEIRATFPFPVSRALKRNPRPATWHTSRPDPDNVAKAVLDAGNGVLWQDDAQVCFLTIEKVVAAQGEAARVEIVVGPAVPLA